jgi:lactoylglutathione lyase
MEITRKQQRCNTRGNIQDQMPVIDHIAILTKDIERLRDYYQRYFDGKAGDKYVNPVSGLRSYFISFGTGAKLELMTFPGISDNREGFPGKAHKGIVHLAFGMDSEADVDDKARLLTHDGYIILRGPRRTGDGYYEFETLDPDSNLVEVTFFIGMSPRNA